MKRSRDEAFVLDDDDAQEHSRPHPFGFSRPPARPRRSSTASRTLSPEPPKRSPTEKPNLQKTTQLASRFSSGARTSSTVPGDLRTLFPAREVKAEATHTPDKRPKQNSVKRESRPNVIDVDGDENDAIPIFNPKEDEIIDLESLEVKLEEEIFQPRPRSQLTKNQLALALVPRNPPILLPWVVIASCLWRSSHLKAGKTVELMDNRRFQITTILQNLETDAICLKGLQLKRARDVDRMLPKKLNELCFVFEVDQNDPRSAEEQCVLDFNLGDILKIRKLIRTNRPYPDCRFNKDLVPATVNDFGEVDIKACMKYVEDNEILVVRWKCTSFYKTAEQRLNFKGIQVNFEQQRLEFLKQAECSSGCSIPPFVQRWAWRDETVLGGSAQHQYRNKPAKKVSIVELSDSEDDLPERRVPLAKTKAPNRKPRSGQMESLRCRLKNSTLTTKSQSGRENGGNADPEDFRYSFGDVFCGAGGMTRGAVQAGLSVLWGLDFNANAGETWRMNFPNSKFYPMWVNDFATLPDPDRDSVVDILHLSPPCQVFSPMKVRAGKNDEMNFASLFAVREMLIKTRPRQVTLEQTFGILHNKYKHAFQALVHMFTDLEFSVGWQVVKFQDWGLAQSRRRLIIVAACPGETLPELPSATHSETGSNGLKCYTSVRSVLSSIPANAANHETHRVRSANYLPWDDSNITTCCMTCGVMFRGHPSGERGFTQREFAALQSFPHDHIFIAQEIRKQIGNAVPPQMAAIILKAVRKHLERCDKAEREQQQAAASS